MLQIGDTAPQFELLSDAGTPTKLSDFRGQQLILFFYPKADTPGCTTQACGFRDQFPIMTARQTAVIGISPDEPQKLAKWKTKQSLPYLLLSDPSHQVAESYGVWGEKKLYGKSYMGILRSHFVIDAAGKIADIQLKVSPEESVKRAVKYVK